MSFFIPIFTSILFFCFLFFVLPTSVESYNDFERYITIPVFCSFLFFSADDSNPVSWPITSGVILLFINLRLEAKGKRKFFNKN